jgi:MFS family permease
VEPEGRLGGIRLILAERAVRAIIALAFLVMVGFGVVLPILALYARSFGVGYGAAGLLVSAFAFTRLGADLVAGPLVDHFGERRAAAAGMVVTAVASFAAGLAPSFGFALVFWGAGGAGSAVMFAAFYSYLLKVVPPDRMARTLGIFYGSFNGGMVAGGLAGGIVAHYLGLAAPLLLYSGILAVAAIAYLRFVPDPTGPVKEPPMSTQEAERERDMPILRRSRTTLARLFRTRGFLTVMIVNLAYIWMVAAVFDTLVPLFAREDLGMSTVAIGVVFAVALATEFVVLYPAGTAADRRGRKPVLLPALAGLALATAVVGWSPTPLLLGVGMAFLGVAAGYAGVPPAAMLSDLTPSEGSGTAVGTFRFFGDLGLLVGPIVAGVTIGAFGFREAFAIAAVPTIIAAVLVARTPETMPSRASLS